MKSRQKPIRTLVSAAVVSMMASATVYAGSFSLYTEGSVTAIGNYAAGAAAEAADASTGWYNPAGLALIRTQQVVGGGVGVFPSSKISGTSTFRTTGLPAPFAPFSVFTQTFNNLDGAKNALVPHFHYARPLGENATFGLSVVSPFGLSTEWSRTSPVRYAATFSELITTDLSPEIGARITDNFALGLGIDLQYTRVKFNSVLGVPTVSNAFTPAGSRNPFQLDSPSYNKGNSFGVGFHAGGMFMFNENHSRLGLNYQSKMDHKFHGYSRLTGRFANPTLTLTPFQVTNSNAGLTYWSNNLYSNNIEFPEIVTLSGYHDVNENLALLGSVVYTGWHTLRSIQLNNVAAFVSGIGQRKVNSISNQDYDNAWRFALGANYKFNETWMLRVGGGYDETPTINSERDIRLPDTNRWALSIGGKYQYSPAIAINAGWTHLWSAGNEIINKTQSFSTTNTYNINATAKARAELVGLGAVWVMDEPMPMPTKK